MSEMISIPREELECLRRHVKEASRLLHALGVQEPKTPELSPREQRISKYTKKLANK